MFRKYESDVSRFATTVTVKRHWIFRALDYVISSFTFVTRSISCRFRSSARLLVTCWYLQFWLMWRVVLWIYFLLKPSFLTMERLPEYPVPGEIYDVLTKKSSNLLSKLGVWSTNKVSMRINANTYIEAFKTMIYFEEAKEQLEAQKCDRTSVKLLPGAGKEFYFEIEPGIDKSTEAMDEVNRFKLTNPNSKAFVMGNIKRREGDRVYLELIENNKNSDRNRKFMRFDSYDMKFEINRTCYQLQHYALNLIKEKQLFDKLIDSRLCQTRESNIIEHKHKHKHSPDCICQELLWKKYICDLNDEQKMAAVNIVDGDYRPFPYILYGPPGTGKTKTLVTAIRKIVQTTRHENVLICAQSNAACDEITDRLSEYLVRPLMIRLYSTSYNVNAIRPSIKKYCNLYADGKLKYSSLESIYNYRVVVCTLATAGCLVRAECKSNHFSHIIIDECASALETMTFLPIAGLWPKNGQSYPKIVLAGDPKQLDAVTKSEWATKLGFGTSWLEQLFEYPLYQRDPLTRKFNSKYITQLVKNYRSHPSILHVPNELFYEGVLESKALRNISDLNIDIPYLNCEFPIIFQSVQGIRITPDHQTSSYNDQEVVQVMAFIQKLLDKPKGLNQVDIGVVSPYKLQCKKIENACKRIGFKDITVGTSEVFQGQERKLMIISTVVSKSRHPGSFVSNPRRLNVVMTRAQYLLIIVGDPHTLSGDPNWSMFINYCYKNKALVQGDRHFKPKLNYWPTTTQKRFHVD